MSTRLLRLGSSLTGVSAFLILLLALLSSAAPARSNQTVVSVPIRSGVMSDTRWIELIRSGGPEPQANQSASSLPTLNLHLIDNLIAGRASSSAPIALVVRRNNTVIVNSSATPYPDGPDYFYAVQFCPPYIALGGGGGCPTLQRGDIISLTQSGASFTMTVPPLTALIDAPSDRAYGTAPISGVVKTYLYSIADSSGPYTQTVNVDAGGQYQADYAGTLDVRPRDNGYAAYSETPGQTTYVRCVAPFLRAQIGGMEISGLAAPRSSVAITLAHNNGTPYLYWIGAAALDGSFVSYLDYGEIELEPGDTIMAASAGQTFSMMVLTVTARIDLANQLIWGEALADQTVDVLRFAGPLCCSTNWFWNDWPAEQTAVTATVAGQYTATLAVTRPNYGAAIVTAPDGNQTYARYTVPYLSARMGSSYWLPYRLTGQIAAVSKPITITIQGPSGYFKDVRRAMAASNGYFADYAGNALTLDTGDIITVATADGVQVALPLPNLTGQIDPVTDIVSGTAPPGARLTAVVYYYGSPIVPPVLTPTPYFSEGGGGLPSTSYTVVVTASAQGEYAVNLHGLIDLGNDSTGEVSLTTTEGHTVSRVLTLSRQQDCEYQPQLVLVGGNQITFQKITGCGQYAYGRVRLRAASGYLKSEQPLPESSWDYFSIVFYTGTQPVAIVPGDTVEVEWHNSPQFEPTPTPTYTPWPAPSPTPGVVRKRADTHLLVIAVPTLTVRLDAVANVIAGQAPPSTTVALNLYHDQKRYYNFTVAADAQGFYTVDLGSEVALAAGDVAYVTYAPIDPPAFSAVGVLPQLRVQLYQGYADGALPPLSAYTITLQTTPPVAALYKGTAYNDGSFYMWLPSVKPADSVTVTTAQVARQLAVPALTAHVDRASAAVFGQAPPFARLRVEPYNVTGVSQDVTATASGAYSASFPNLAPLNTTYGKLTYFDADGDLASLSFATVHWDVEIDDECWRVIVDAAGLPLTATLRRGNGELKSTLHFTPTYYTHWACFTTTVQSGDQIFLQSAAATEIFTVPVLAARHNYTRQAVEGVAPPNHDLYFEAWWRSGIYRHTYSTGSGQYGVDTSDLYPPLLARGRVYVYDTAGNTASVYFTVQGYPLLLPLIRR